MSLGITQLKKGGFLVIIALILTLSSVNYAASESQVDVGLIFGANNTFPIGISSTQGFIFGVDNAGMFQSIMDLSSYKAITLYKDGFYNPELVTVNAPYYLEGKVKMAYHLQMGELMMDYQEAALLLNQVKILYPEAYLMIDQGWRVFYGAYLTENEALSAVMQVSAGLSGVNVRVASPVMGSVIVMNQDQILFSYNSTERDYAFKTDVFELNGVKYRNMCIVKRINGSDFTVINRVTMSEYLYGVVPKEMNGDWPIEALKAQAIAAKNYVLTNPSKYTYGFDVCNTISSQVYGGYSAEKPRSNQAVDEMKGMVLTHAGKVIPLYYHSSSGGVTDASENVWSSALPYLKTTLDVYSLDAPNADWSLTMSKADIEVKLIIAGFNIGALNRIQIIERAPSGRVTQMAFVGSNGTARLDKDKVRSILGSTLLKSMLFSFEPTTLQVNVQAPTQSTALVNQNIEPVFVRSNEGIFSKLIGSNQVSIEGKSGVVTKTVDINALRNAKDIYQSSNPQTVFNIYGFKNTETIDISGSSVVFYGHGYGHGLGMSQWGAKKMADQGMTYEQILKFYYADTQLSFY